MRILAVDLSGSWIRLVHGLVIIIALVAQGAFRRAELTRMRLMR